jgi:hypothetical protein
MHWKIGDKMIYNLRNVYSGSEDDVIYAYGLYNSFGVGDVRAEIRCAKNVDAPWRTERRISVCEPDPLIVKFIEKHLPDISIDDAWIVEIHLPPDVLLPAVMVYKNRKLACKSVKKFFAYLEESAEDYVLTKCGFFD